MAKAKVIYQDKCGGYHDLPQLADRIDEQHDFIRAGNGSNLAVFGGVRVKEFIGLIVNVPNEQDALKAIQQGEYEKALRLAEEEAEIDEFLKKALEHRRKARGLLVRAINDATRRAKTASQKAV